MRGNQRPYVILAALAAVLTALLGWQHHIGTKLRDEIAGRRIAQQERAQLEAEQQKLTAAQLKPAELDALLAERAAVARLQAELATLQQRVKAAAAIRLQPKSNSPQTVPSIKDSALSYQLWTNAGQSTPEAAFETALWASAGGEIDALVPLLVFDAEVRNEAATLFSNLPPALRQEFVSPERLVAVMVAKDVPLGSATILNQYPTPTDTKMAVQIFDEAGKQRVVLLSLRSDTGGWRFVVPKNAVTRYAAWLHPSMVTTLPLP